jgi:hypothetical protein
MVDRLSVDALFLHKQAVSGHKKAGFPAVYNRKKI